METSYTIPTPQSNGGKATAKKLRQEALDRYYASPNLCQQCNQVIAVVGNQKIKQARDKKFCNRTCSGIFNYAKRENKPSNPKNTNRKCVVCSGSVASSRTYCGSCWHNAVSVDSMLKKDSSHAKIRGHARNKVKSWERHCFLCGYDKHVDVCHIIPVASFADDAVLSDINDPKNLVLLCKNHHWEFDHNKLDDEHQTSIAKLVSESLGAGEVLESSRFSPYEGDH